jgi:spore coat polysaccharide biosynthesis protein SpsF (cytidylyltransferase family)
MLNTIGIVEVRGEGARSPGIGRKLGGLSILEWVVRRATDCQRLDAVVVLADVDEDAVRPLVPPDVEVVSRAGLDPLAGTLAVCRRFSARAIVHIGADTPFVDPVLVDRLVSTADAHPDCDYIGYCCRDGRPAIRSKLGVFAEWCSAQALRRAASAASTVADRRQVTSYLYSHPERFHVRLIPLPAELDRDDLRLAIAGEEDWEHAQVIYEALGHDALDWRRIADLLDHQPALRERMALLNQAHVA